MLSINKAFHTEHKNKQLDTSATVTALEERKHVNGISWWEGIHCSQVKIELRYNKLPM